jgi:hypothetical protein
MGLCCNVSTWKKVHITFKVTCFTSDTFTNNFYLVKEDMKFHTNQINIIPVPLGKNIVQDMSLETIGLLLMTKNTKNVFSLLCIT